MANELTIAASLSFAKGSISGSMESGTIQQTVSGSDFVRETWTVPTSVTAIPLGSIATAGYTLMVNRDATNFVDIYDSTGGNACVRIKPLACALFQFKTTAPAAKADTATCQLDFIIISA